MPVRDREALRRHIEEWLAAFPDLRLQEVDHLAAGNRVTSLGQITGTHTGAPFQGIEAAGGRVEVTIVAIFDGDGQRLVSHGTLLDAARLLEQLTRARKS